MNKKNRKAIQILAIVLVVLMVGSVIVSGLMAAIAEEMPAVERNQYTIDMEYLSEEQALRMSQRLVYINRGDCAVDSVVFYVMGNMFRRESALMYENDDLENVFYAGYAPAGLDIQKVKFNGSDADWGMQGEDELYIRVSCEIMPGESGVFEFLYYLLLPECAAFMGIGETDVRLSAFYFIPGVFNDHYDEFDLNKPLPFTRWLYSDTGDYEITLRIPDNYLPAATGAETIVETADHMSVWKFEAQNIREAAVSFGKKYREDTGKTSSGVNVRVLSNARDGKKMVQYALEAIETCEEWFGDFPAEALDIVQSDYPLGSLNFPGTIWISKELFNSENDEKLKQEIRFCIAQQYLGLSAYVKPSSDAWLSDSICAYIACMMLEEHEGRNAFLDYINREWVSAIQFTVPGGLNVTSEATLFDGKEYDVIVKKRGAVVMHELANAMGKDMFIDGVRRYILMGRDGHTLTEMELVNALDEVSGRSWEAFLTDWLFNVNDYVDQSIDWFE